MDFFEKAYRAGGAFTARFVQGIRIYFCAIKTKGIQNDALSLQRFAAGYVSNLESRPS
jgi:hypothetical protein